MSKLCNWPYKSWNNRGFSLKSFQHVQQVLYHYPGTGFYNHSFYFSSDHHRRLSKFYRKRIFCTELDQKSSRASQNAEKLAFLYTVQTPGSSCQCKVLDPSLIKNRLLKSCTTRFKREVCSFVLQGPPASVSKNYCFTLCVVWAISIFQVARWCIPFQHSLVAYGFRDAGGPL